MSLQSGPSARDRWIEARGKEPKSTEEGPQVSKPEAKYLEFSRFQGRDRIQVSGVDDGPGLTALKQSSPSRWEVVSSGKNAQLVHPMSLDEDYITFRVTPDNESINRFMATADKALLADPEARKKLWAVRNSVESGIIKADEYRYDFGRQGWTIWTAAQFLNVFDKFLRGK